MSRPLQPPALGNANYDSEHYFDTVQAVWVFLALFIQSFILETP